MAMIFIFINRYTLIQGGFVFLFSYISLIPFYYLQPVGFDVNTSTITIFKYLPIVLIAYLTLLILSFYGISSFMVICSFSKSLVFFICFYLIICLLSILANAEFIGIGILKFIYYTLTGGYLFLLVVLLFTQKKMLYSTIHWIISIATLVAIYGITVYLINKDYIWGGVNNAYNPYYSGFGRIGSTLGNPNAAGSYLLLCLPFFFFLLHGIYPGFSKKILIYRICTSIVLMGIWLTFSRGSWIAAGVSCGIYLHLHLKNFTRFFKRTFKLETITVYLVVLMLLIPVINTFGDNGLYRLWSQSLMRIEKTLNLVETEASRLAIYKTSWRVIQDYPLLGVGFGNFTRLFDKYKDPTTPKPVSEYTAVKTTDNMYLMVLCETGFLGLVAFLGLMFSLGQLTYKRYRMASPGPDREIYRATLAGFCGFLVNMMTWDAFNQPTVRMTFWIILGIALNPLLMEACTNSAKMDKK